MNAKTIVAVILIALGVVVRAYSGITYTTPPVAPSDFTAVADANSQVTLSWTPATENESGLKGYLIYRDGLFLTFVPEGTSSFKDTSATGATDAYDLAAMDKAGNVSALALRACKATVTTSSSPSGGGTTSGGRTQPCGKSFTVTATPNTGYSFVNWTHSVPIAGEQQG